MFLLGMLAKKLWAMLDSTHFTRHYRRSIAGSRSACGAEFVHDIVGERGDNSFRGILQIIRARLGFFRPPYGGRAQLGNEPGYCALNAMHERILGVAKGRSRDLLSFSHKGA
jgi:hypothetical protein